MDLDVLIMQFGVYLAAVIVAFGGGIFPILNMELFLIGVYFARPDLNVLLIFLIAWGGQVAAKGLLYLGGRGIVRIPGKRFRNALEKAEDWVREREKMSGIGLLTGSAFGFPPIYIMSIVSGSMKLSISVFFTFICLGIGIRYTLLFLIVYSVRALR